LSEGISKKRTKIDSERKKFSEIKKSLGGGALPLRKRDRLSTIKRLQIGVRRFSGAKKKPLLKLLGEDRKNKKEKILLFDTHRTSTP